MGSFTPIGSNERDVLAEVANMSMGSAATSLSQLIKQEVNITTPTLEIREFEELFGSFTVPYVAIRVNFTEGIKGFNLLVIKLDDAKTILRLLMGERGNTTHSLDDLEMSALSEIMNQMMGGCATALNQIYKLPISISTPHLQFVDITSRPGDRPDFLISEPLVTIAFKFQIGSEIDSQVLQVIPQSYAKEQAAMILGGSPRDISPPGEREVHLVEKADFPPLEKRQPHNQPRNIELLMDIPLDASVVLGTTSKTIQQILTLAEGSVLELDKLVEEPVDLYINNVPIARGEIVVINENFGLRITEIISSARRLESLQQLKKC